MFTAKQFRAKAAESAKSLKHTDVASEVSEFQRSQQSFSELADNEDWLARNFDKMIRSRSVPLQDDKAGGRRLDRKAVAEIEEHHFALPRGGRHHAVEYDPDQAPTRTLRYRRFARRRT